MTEIRRRQLNKNSPSRSRHKTSSRRDFALLLHSLGRLLHKVLTVLIPQQILNGLLFQTGMDVGNMHALRLLLVTQCPLHSQDERLTGRTGAVAAVDDRIAYLQTVALSQVLDVVSHRAVSCSSCSSVQQK